MSDDKKVLGFTPTVYGSRREPALSDKELIRVRQMLRDFDKIGNVCPIARRVMYGRDDQGSAS